MVGNQEKCNSSGGRKYTEPCEEAINTGEATDVNRSNLRIVCELKDSDLSLIMYEQKSGPWHI